MTLFTSGDWIVDSKKLITETVYDFMCGKFPQIVGSVVEVNQVDLTDDNAFGFCQLEDDLMYREFLIHIHNDLTPEPYVTTLIHELVHVRQTCDGLLDHDRREEEAVIWEKILSKEFWETFKNDTFYSTPWKSQDRIYALNSPTSPLFS